MPRGKRTEFPFRRVVECRRCRQGMVVNMVRAWEEKGGAMFGEYQDVIGHLISVPLKRPDFKLMKEELDA